MVLGALVGTLTALGAALFVALARGSSHWLTFLPPQASSSGSIPGWLVAVATVGIPTAGGLVAGLIHSRLLKGRPQGPADVIEAVQTRRPLDHGPTGFLSTCSAWVSLGCGASVGQYGPLVHLGGTVGAMVAGQCQARADQVNTALACGVAAAIATAFGAPISGILFAFEVVLRHFSPRAFAPLAVAASLGYLIAAAIGIHEPFLIVQGRVTLVTWEYGLLVAIGALGGVVAVVYMGMILTVTQLAGRWRLPSLWGPAIAGAVVGLGGLWVPEILGLGFEVLAVAPAGAYGFGELGLILVCKLLATALCLGLGFAGGGFSPALFIGVLFGVLVGGGLEHWLGMPAVDLTAYAIAGMVAVTAPVIGAPVTTVVIVLELTQNYTLTAVALTSVALANGVAAKLLGPSLFDLQLSARGLDLAGGRSKVLLDQRQVRELISDDYVAVAPALTVATARQRLALAGKSVAYIQDEAGRLLGVLPLAALVNAPEGIVVQWLHPPQVILTPECTLNTAMVTLETFVGESVPVVDGDGRLVGVVFETALIRAYLATVATLQREGYGHG